MEISISGSNKTKKYCIKNSKETKERVINYISYSLTEIIDFVAITSNHKRMKVLSPFQFTFHSINSIHSIWFSTALIYTRQQFISLSCIEHILTDLFTILIKLVLISQMNPKKNQNQHQIINAFRNVSINGGQCGQRVVKL